jgi:hypothetical protein
MSQPRAPGSIVTAAVLMFVYGGMLLFCGVCSSASTAFQDEKAKAMHAELLKEAPALTTISIVTNGIYLLLGLVFIVSGIGVLRLVKLFRGTAYLACAAILLITIASSVYTTIYVFPVQQRLILEDLQKNNPPMPIDMNLVMSASMALGLLIGIGFPLLLCVLIVVFLNLKSARDAFAGITPEPAEDDPYAIRRSPRREDSDDYEPPKPPQSPGDTGITDKGQ